MNMFLHLCLCYTIFCTTPYNLLHRGHNNMCGCYQFTEKQCAEIRQIVDAIQRKYGVGSWIPGEIRPTARVPVLVAGQSYTPSPALMRWGFLISNGLVINARAETAAEKPMFRNSVQSRRCLIPSTGFFEWDGDRRKYLFTLPGEDVLYIAGLYTHEVDEDQFCILTTVANKSMRLVHNRMPLILNRNQCQRWLYSGDDTVSLLSIVPPELVCSSAEAQVSLWDL